MRNKIIGLVIGALLAAPLPALAQSSYPSKGGQNIPLSVMGCLDAGGKAVPVDQAGACPGGGGSSVSVSDVTHWSGALLGAATAYGTPPTGNVMGVNSFVTNTVTVTAASWPLPTGAATAANQTATQGTSGSTLPSKGMLMQLSDGTNAQNARGDALGGVGIIGSRPGRIRTTLSYGQTSYLTTLCLGNLQTIQLYASDGVTALPAGTLITAGNIRIMSPTSNWTVVGNGQLAFFETAPGTPANYNDNSAFSYTADIAKSQPVVAVSGVNNNSFASWAGAIPARFPVNASGQLIFSVSTTSTSAFNAAGALFMEIDYTY